MQYTLRLSVIIFSFLGFGLLTAQQCSAQQLVYHPKNPAFGGNPLNYQWLLSSANTQNLYKEKANYDFQKNPLDNFQESLQRQILSQITRNLVYDKFGENFDLSQESRLEFGEFTIDVTPGLEGVTIRIYNVVTGEETSVTIPNLNG